MHRRAGMLLWLLNCYFTAISSVCCLLNFIVWIPLKLFMGNFYCKCFFLSYLLILQEKLIHTLFLFDSLIPIVTSAYNFLLQYQPWDKFESHKGNDYQIKQLLVVEQILLISTLEKCLANSMKKIHTDIRVERVNKI